MFFLEHIHWAGLNNSIVIPVFAVLVVLIIKNYFMIAKVAAYLVNATYSKQLFVNFSLRRYRVKTIFVVMSIIAVGLALLQPQWGVIENKVVQEGRDLLVLLDVSRSMLAQDFKPSRLEFAKLKIRHVLERLKFERVGLILFSGEAFLQCPLTSDYQAFLMFLEQVDVETISSGTTSLDRALMRALGVYSTVEGRKNKLVWVLTDGEDYSLSLAPIKEEAKKNNITLFASGIGSTEGAPIPILDKYGKQVGHEVSANGSVELSKLNEKMLQDLCSQLNGHYFKVGYSDDDVEQLVSTVQQFEKERFEDRALTLYEHRYPWFLGIAWVLLLIEWIL